MKKLMFAVIAAVSAMSAAHAAGPYVGAAVTTSEYAVAGDDEYKAGGKVFAGYDITPLLGVEAGYTDLKHTGGTDGRRSYVAGKATMPVNEQVSVYGKLGVGYNKVKFDNGFGKQSDTEAYGALGAQYTVNPKVALVAEYERYGSKKDWGASANQFSLGARYNF
jgi:OOP family OmpA-OmpF porin